MQARNKWNRDQAAWEKLDSEHTEAMKSRTNSEAKSSRLTGCYQPRPGCPVQGSELPPNDVSLLAI